MRRRLSVLFVLCLLLFSMTGIVSANNEFQSVSSSAEYPVADVQTIFEPGSVPASAAELDAISLPIHGLAAAMLEENLPYDTDSDQFLWTALYHILVLYGSMDDRTEIYDGALVLPAEVLYDFLSSFAFDRCDLPSIPDKWTKWIQYDSSSDFFRIIPRNTAPSCIHILRSHCTEYGLLILDAVLISKPGNAVVSSVRVCLRPQDNMFGYCVTDLSLSS